MAGNFYAYILAGESAVLYTGMTNDLQRRMREHRAKLIPGFTKRYNVTKLVWFEVHGNAGSAIEREKQIKNWSRAKKIALVERSNPHWTDLSAKLGV
jgi:putative endonuclease